MAITDGKQEPNQRLDHWKKSVDINTFIGHTRNKTLAGLSAEGGRDVPITDSYTYRQGAGPTREVDGKEETFFVKDPLDPPQNGEPGGVIDMKHFVAAALIPGGFGEWAGLAAEIDQQRRRYPSAHFEEDYKSNFLGVVFRNNYWQDDYDVSNEFQEFFDDYSQGQLKGFWPTVDRTVTELSQQGAEGLEQLGNFIEDYAKRGGQQGLQQLRNLQQKIENLLQINPVDELRKLYDRLTSAEQLLTAQLDPIQSPEQRNVETTATVSSAALPDIDPTLAANEQQREQPLSSAEHPDEAFAQFGGTVEQLLQQHQGLASLTTGTLAFSPNIQSVDGSLNGEAESESSESSQIDQEYRAMRQQQYQDFRAGRASREQSQPEAGADQIALG